MSKTFTVEPTFETAESLGLVKGGRVSATTALVKVTHRPRTFEEDRYCPEGGCGVKLASYNKGPKCYLHSTPKFPRVRGVIERNM